MVNISEFIGSVQGLMKVLPQNTIHHQASVWEHTKRVVALCPSRLFLPAILHDIGKAYIEGQNGFYPNHAKIGVTCLENIDGVDEWCKRIVGEHHFIYEVWKNRRADAQIQAWWVKNCDIFEDLVLLSRADVLSDHPDGTRIIARIDCTIEYIRAITSTTQPVDIDILRLHLDHHRYESNTELAQMKSNPVI